MIDAPETGPPTGPAPKTTLTAASQVSFCCDKAKPRAADIALMKCGHFGTVLDPSTYAL
jgi:hypothetical protein